MKMSAWAMGWLLLGSSAGMAGAAEWFVATNGSDAAEGTSWATAKQTIQAGIDAASSNDVVWVSNGVYATGGGRAVVGTRANRVSIDRSITVRSVNGPAETLIVGGGMRCAYVTNGAVLSGFTLTNGTTASGMCGMPETDTVDHYGGGALCEDDGMLTNCVLTGNWACYAGGGSSGGLLNNCLWAGNTSDTLGGGSHAGVLNHCVLSNNAANSFGGGGSWKGTLNHCLLTHNYGGSAGGGAHDSTLNHCVLRNNHAGSQGGGACQGVLNNCLLTGNSVILDGGGAVMSTLNNCTIVSNATQDEFGIGGGGTYDCTANNCIVFGNTSASGDPNWHGGTFLASCTTPLTAGTSNVTNDPQFVDAAAGNYRLAAGSPCIEAGENAFAIGLRDLDGNPRIVNAVVDMGAYEYQDGTYLVIAPLATNLDSGASSGHEIEVLASVSWTAATNVSWLSVTSGASRTTNGTVRFDVAANAGAARTGAVIVAGGGLARTCAVVQAAFVPELEIEPASTNVGSGAAGGLTAVVTANMDWTASTNVPWLAITAGGSGSGHGSVVFSATANEAIGVPRTGRVVVAGGGLSRTCTVVQAGTAVMLEIDPGGTNLSNAAFGGLALDVTANVAWTAATNVTWLSITSGRSGTTNGTVVFSVASNETIYVRMGAVVVTGGGIARTCTVVQAGGPIPPVVWHVATNGSDAAAGTNWATAKQTIQAAVDAATTGDMVWVSNGVYATGGGRAVVGTRANRVSIDRAVTVCSVNGPDETFIEGAGMRCAYVTNGATLAGFTLTNGTTAVASELNATNIDYDGGGTLCEAAAIVTNCILTGNWASEEGGGAVGGCLYDCCLNGNSTWNMGGGSAGGIRVRCVYSENHADMAGGGAEGGTLTGCTLTNNSSAYGGGTVNSTMDDCLIQKNTAGDEGGGVFGGTLQRCIVQGNHCTGWTGGGGAARGAVLYNCLLDGNRADSVLGDEPAGGGAKDCTLVNCTVVGNTGFWGGGVRGGAMITCIVYGNTATNNPNWQAGAFTTCCTTPLPSGAGNLTNAPLFVDAGAGNYRLAAGSPCINAGDNAAAPGTVDLDGSPRIVFGTVDMGAYEFLYQHVAPGGSDGASGFSWATAKQTIQAAVDATTNGCIVWVTNGVYATGGRTVGSWELTNRVAIDRPIIVQSVNGPEVTTIQGAGPMGDAAVRCAYVGSNAVLSGFTLTNGATKVFSPGNELDASGAGLWCEPSAIIQRCLIVNNQASLGAGGCLYGKLHDCLFVGNTAGSWGGGAYESVLYNCTLTGNGAYDGGGVFRATALNSIIWGNTATNGENYFQGSISNSCTTPDPGGTSNVVADPQFVDAAAGDYRLQATSPCLDAGDDGAVSWAEDLGGNQRIVYGAVDMGAYELQLTGEGTWFGAITNGQTGDLDCVAGDGVPNLLKYATGGSPRISDDKMLVDWAWNGGLPALTFNRNPNATDVWFVVECAEAISNGAAWRGVATNVGGSWLGATNVSESGAGNPVACTVTDPVALGTNRFLRLQVSRP